MCEGGGVTGEERGRRTLGEYKKMQKTHKMQNAKNMQKYVY
jgi:hypothetical protein